MFEETLLIIKNDYLPKRKILLIKLLGYGFQIQTNRRVLFTPELAAQFYGDNTDDGNFMLQVILLSKGPAEAFILTMENAVQQLINSTICYFCTSVEADRHVHVSQTLTDACREIKFIFPNYICEPILYFDASTFCRNNNMKEMVAEIYNIMKTQEDEPKTDWKLRLAEWLRKSNKNLPIVTNECVAKPNFCYEEKSVQTKTAFKQDEQSSAVTVRSFGSTPIGASAQFSSTSCISCHGFESSMRSENACKDLVAAKKALSEADTEKLRQVKDRMKSEEEEEQVSEEHICEEVEYIIVQEETRQLAKIEIEEQTNEEHVDEEAEVSSEQNLKAEISVTIVKNKSLAFMETKSAADVLDEEETFVTE